LVERQAPDAQMARYGTIVSAMIVVLIAFFVLAPRLRCEVRDRTQQYLAARFQSDVQIRDFDIALFPRIRIAVDGIVLRLHGRTDVPPLIEIDRLSFDANLCGLLGKAVTIHEVDLAGWRIHTPPRYPDSPPALQGTDQDFAKNTPSWSSRSAPTTTGAKSFLLKAVDPFFSKKNRARNPRRNHHRKDHHFLGPRLPRRE
jgi:hypothetical protein